MSDAADQMWWDEPEGDCHERLVDLVDRLRSRDGVRMSRARVHEDVYMGRWLLDDVNTDALRYVTESGLDRSTLNYTRSAVDFVHAKVTAQPPDVKCASRGGDWSQQLRAKKLTRYLSSQSEALKLPERAAQALHMALRQGTGVLKVSALDGEVQLDVVPVVELTVDPGESRYGRPPHLYQITAVPRMSLAERFGDVDGVQVALDGASAPRDPVDRGVPSDSDLVDVYEAWALPDADGEGGRHVVCVQGATLVDEGWGHPRFPFAVVHDTPPAPGRGFWGQGLVERLLPNQWEVDGLVHRIGRAIDVAGTLKVFVEHMDSVNVDALQDPTVGVIVSTGGTRPPVISPISGVPGELFQHLRFMIEQLFSLAGMSQDAASSMKPAGLSSGVALTTYHDFATQRHIDLAKRFSQLVLDASELMIDRAKDLAEDDEDWVARYARGSSVRQIPWSEVDMDRDQFVLELSPVSAVADSYSGRLQLIERMAQTGQMPPSLVASLVEDPDTVRMNRTLAADANFVEFVIDELIDPERPMPPVMDEQNLGMTVDLVRAALMDAVAEGAPPEVVDRFQTYLQDCVDRMPMPQPPAPESAPVDPAVMAPVAATLG